MKKIIYKVYESINDKIGQHASCFYPSIVGNVAKGCLKWRTGVFPNIKNGMFRTKSNWNYTCY